MKQTVVQDLPVEEGKVRRSLAFGVIDVGLKEVGVSSTELDEESSSERVKEVGANNFDRTIVRQCSLHRLRKFLRADIGKGRCKNAGTLRGSEFAAGIHSKE